MGRLKNDASDEEMENWKTQRTTKMSKITANERTFETKTGRNESIKIATVL